MPSAKSILNGLTLAVKKDIAMPSPSELVLLDKYKLIKTIGFHELRTKLIWTVTHIFSLMKSGGGLGFNRKSQAMVGRYLDYLGSSCQNRATLNRRAKWLSIYGHCVHLDLLRLKVATQYKSVNGQVNVHSALADLIIKLILKVSEVKTVIYKQASLDHDIIRTLERMAWTGFLIDSETTSHYYFEIIAKIESLIECLDRSIATPLVVTEDNDYLLYELDLIDKKISNLLLLQDEYSTIR